MSTEFQPTSTRTTIEICAQDFILDWANQFYQAKKVEGVSPFTLTFYKSQLGHFLKYCQAQVITRIPEINQNVIRQFLLWHEQTGHNPGGLHAAFRVLRTFLIWYENEVEPEGWKNPIHKVKAPRLAEEPLDPIKLGDVSVLVTVCNGGKFLELRDKALFFFLLDTGARAREVLKVDLADIDLVKGELLIRQGKGRKSRKVFLGKASRKAMRAYLKIRKDTCNALWISNESERLEYSGLRAILTRRAEQAGINHTSLHSFRRAFALNCLKNGMDIYSLQNLMGHADLQVLRRYLKQTDQDIQEAHKRASPVDCM